MAHKKRHHSSSRGERHMEEVRGHYGKSDQGKGHYGVTENADSGMIHDDWGAPALLPQRVIDRDWPRSGNYMDYGEADLFMGVQKQLNKDGEDMKREFKAGKY